MKALTILHGNIVHAPALGKLDIVENGYLILEDGIISGIFPQLPEQYAGAAVTDFGSDIIMPSFCDMHLHAPQFPMLGMGMDLPLLDWLNTYTFKTESRFANTDYARKIYRQLASELIRNGTTRVCAFGSLHREATLILMEEFEKAGITGYVGKVNMDRNSCPELQETTEESIKNTYQWLEECKKFKAIHPILTPRFTPSCTNELMAELGKIADERGLYVQSHLSENTSEIAWVRELHPDCPQYWETYQKYGLFKSHTVMAHCVHSDERERKAILDNNVVVAHCPDSNVNLISGVAPIRTMLNEGIWVTLGSDIAGGAELSMLRVTAHAIRSSKFKRIETHWTDDFLTVSKAYYLASSAGARYFGAREGFAIGDKLHAIVINDANRPDTEHLSVKDRFERTFYLADAQNIVAVYSDGKRVV